MTDYTGRFAEKTALITGAASGIGRQIALRFAGEGADVAACDVNREGLDETADGIRERGQKALPLVCDVGVEDDIAKTVEAVYAGFAQVDILVNCAGIGDSGAGFDDITAQLWDRIFAVNVRGPFLLIQKIAPRMIESNIKGRIVNIASCEGKQNFGNKIVYPPSKAALINLTHGLARQLGLDGITVNAVCPGLIDTPIWHKSDSEMGLPPGSTVQMVVDTALQNMQLKIPRIGTTGDIAGAVLFLCSPDADYITGQSINVCGGLCAF